MQVPGGDQIYQIQKRMKFQRSPAMNSQEELSKCSVFIFRVPRLSVGKVILDNPQFAGDVQREDGKRNVLRALMELMERWVALTTWDSLHLPFSSQRLAIPVAKRMFAWGFPKVPISKNLGRASRSLQSAAHPTGKQIQTGKAAPIKYEFHWETEWH